MTHDTVKVPKETQEFIDMLRTLAALYEAHPTLPLPYFGGTFNAPVSKDELFLVARELRCKPHLGSTYAEVKFTLDEKTKLEFYVSREMVCERVQIATKKEKRPVMVKTGEEEVEVPVYKWVCPDDLMAAEEQA
jgi:hypothetical protein